MSGQEATVPVTPPEREMTGPQFAGICALLGRLDRPLPRKGTVHLSFDAAGHLIIKLRAEVLALTEGTETR